MWYLIAGVGKSGTTALFYAVAQAVPHATRSFERRSVARIAAYNGSAADLVAKMLIAPGKLLSPESLAGVERFEKRLLIIRDPRDVVVSKYMWEPSNHGWLFDERAFVDLRSLLAQKEREPSSVSMLDILRCQMALSGRQVGASSRTFVDDLTEFLAGAGASFHVVKYEEFCAGATAEVSGYLGLEIAADPPIPDAKHARVARSKSSGNWRDWLNEEDVETFRPLFAPFLKRFGYDEDWSLPARQVVGPQHCTGYLEKLREASIALARERPPTAVGR